MNRNNNASNADRFGDEACHRSKINRLRRELAIGERDLAAGRYTEITDDRQLAEFFDLLLKDGRRRTRRTKRM